MRNSPARVRRPSVRKVNDTFSCVRNRNEQGIALITSLLLLILMSILGLGMVLAVNSDMLINGYYGNYRSAYYSADAGINVARQALISQIQGQVSQTPCLGWGPTQGTGCISLPLTCVSLSNCAAATNALNAVTTTWGSSFNTWGSTSSTSTNSGQAANSWPGGFMVSPSSTFTVSTLPTLPCTTCTYVFHYTLLALGQGAGLQQVKTTEIGYLTLNISPGSSSGGSSTITTSFSSFGAFISNFAANSSPLVSGTVTGPQFTNGSWNFGSGGTYTFTDPVSQSGATVSYDFNNGGGYHYVDCGSSGGTNCSSDGTSATYNHTTIAPNFQQGLNLGMTTAPLPASDSTQQWAVLDGMGCNEGSNVCGNSASPPPPAVTNANRNTYLKDPSQNPYPVGGASTGVYLPYTGTTLNGGGFYLEGGADSITLNPGTDGTASHNPTQIYTIVQGNTTTTITTNIATNSTVVNSSTTTTTTTGCCWWNQVTTTTTTNTPTLTLNGVPKNKVTGTPTPQTLVYANGDIGGSSGGGNYTGLSGPGQGQAAIQNGVQLTVVANGDINIVGDLMYKQEPVTLTTADTLIPANNYNQVLGLYTQSGNLVLTSPYSNNNLEIDAAIAAIGSSCPASSCGLATPSGGINTLTIVGGRMEANAHSVSMSASNTYYDRRFLTPGFSPPWFPSTQVNANVIPSVPTAPIVQPAYSKLQWYTSPQN